MPDYRRAYVPGGTFFFTLVTYGRGAFLCEDRARPILRSCLAACRRRHPFTIDAMVLLPDHLHAVWTLPKGDADFSCRFALLKKTFTQQWLAAGGYEGVVSDSRRRNRRRGVWQRRFWEHVIRDENDLNKHLDYIHYNPVKHALASCPHAWPYSTFKQWVRNRGYPPDWCCACKHEVMPPDTTGLRATAME
jgi:putative transposase